MLCIGGESDSRTRIENCAVGREKEPHYRGVLIKARTRSGQEFRANGRTSIFRRRRARYLPGRSEIIAAPSFLVKSLDEIKLPGFQPNGRRDILLICPA